MNVIEIIPVDSEAQALLIGSDPQQQKEIRAQLRKDLSLSMSDSVTLVQRLAAGEQAPTSWAESGVRLATLAPDLVAQVRELAGRDRFQAMRSLRADIDGLGINEAKSLVESLPQGPPAAAAG